MQQTTPPWRVLEEPTLATGATDAGPPSQIHNAAPGAPHAAAGQVSLAAFLPRSPLLAAAAVAAAALLIIAAFLLATQGGGARWR